MARAADPVLAQRRRRQIMDAAMACFRRRGFHQASMQEICTAADISAGALYRYFPSKSDLIAAIAEEDRSNVEPLFEAIASGDDLIEGLCAFASHVVAKCGAESTIAADLIAETIRDKDLSEKFAHHQTAMRAKLTTAIASAQRRARLALKVSPERAARIVVLMLDGLLIRAAARGAEEARPLVDDFRVVIENLFSSKPKSAAPATTRALATLSEESDR